MEPTKSFELSGLNELELPEDWYVDPAGEHPDLGIPDNWWVVVTPDGGAVAAFADHGAALGYLLVTAFGQSGAARDIRHGLTPTAA